jgi:hypothetical protein
LLLATMVFCHQRLHRQGKGEDQKVGVLMQQQQRNYSLVNSTSNFCMAASMAADLVAALEGLPAPAATSPQSLAATAGAAAAMSGATVSAVSTITTITNVKPEQVMGAPVGPVLVPHLPPDASTGAAGNHQTDAGGDEGEVTAAAAAAAAAAAGQQWQQCWV